MNSTPDERQERHEPAGKQRRLDTAENRAYPYEQFRREKLISVRALDVDTIEWRFDQQGQPVPCAILELKRYEITYGLEAPASWLDWCLHSTLDGMQGKVLRALQIALDCKAFIVAFRSDALVFWVYCLDMPEAGWVRMEKETYRRFLDKRQPGRGH